MAVAVEVADHERDDRLARAEFDRVTELAAVHRPHRGLAADDRDEIRLRVADDIGDQESVARGRQALLRDAALDLEDAGLRLLEEHDRAGLSRVDDVEQPVAVEVERNDRVDLVRHGNLDPLEAPVRRDLVQRGRRLDRIVGRGAFLLHMQLDAALEVVRRDEVGLPVAIEVAGCDRARVRVDLDDIEPIEAEVTCDIGGVLRCGAHRGRGGQQDGREGGESGDGGGRV